jgi:hypothetical protein
VAEKKRPGRYLWRTILILALVIPFLSLFYMGMSQHHIDGMLEQSGSSLTWQSLDENTAAALYYIYNRTNLVEMLFGPLGVFCAWGLKRKESFAWKLGVFWGKMLIASGIMSGAWELLILRWPQPCLLTFTRIGFGIIVLVCLLRVQKEYQNHP